MKCTFVSNYINHHQIPLSQCLYERLGDGYRFVQTQPMEAERRAMGWEADTERLPWLIRSYEEPELFERLLSESDVVIFGGCEREELILPRLKEGRPVLRYSERIYKDGQWKCISPKGLLRKYRDHIRFRRAPAYLLCAGAYVASDYRLIHAYPGKMLRFGYFTEFVPFEKEELHAERIKNDVPVILWAGRFLSWKHPDDALRLAADLRDEGLRFRLCMVGGGELERELKEWVKEKELEELVDFTGFMNPKQVRERMRHADVFLFTSDHREGWGAVLNESMNSGCAVVADAAAGASPYLIEDGKNGFRYPNGDYKKMKERVRQLLADPALRFELGSRAYETIRDVWNPRTAADRLLALCGQITGWERAARPECAAWPECAAEPERAAEPECAARPERRGKTGAGPRAPRVGQLMLAESGPVSPAPVVKPGLWNQRSV